MSLSPVQKGKIVEAHVANQIMLLSEGELSPFLPIADDAGIDLVVTRKRRFSTLFLQVKSRFKASNRNKNRLDFQVEKESIVDSPQMFLLCVYFPEKEGTIRQMWMIPASVVIAKAIPLESAYRIVANWRDGSNDSWAPYRVSPVELVSKLRTVLG